MTGKKPIKCQDCGFVIVEDENNLRYYIFHNYDLETEYDAENDLLNIIYQDIKCPKCGKVVVYANKAVM